MREKRKMLVKVQRDFYVGWGEGEGLGPVVIRKSSGGEWDIGNTELLIWAFRFCKLLVKSFIFTNSKNSKYWIFLISFVFTLVYF